MIRRILGLGPSRAAMDDAFKILQKLFELQLINQNIFDRANLAIHQKNHGIVDLINQEFATVTLLVDHQNQLKIAREKQDKSAIKNHEEFIQNYRSEVKVFLTKLQLNLGI